MQRDGRLSVNSVVSDNGGSANGRTKNGKLMKMKRNKKTKRSEGTKNSRRRKRREVLEGRQRPATRSNKLKVHLMLMLGYICDLQTRCRANWKDICSASQ